MNMVLDVIVVAATALGSGMAFPQARRLFRTRRVEGVSAEWVGVSLALNGWWLVYGLAADVWALVPVSMLSLLLYASIAVLYVHSTGWPSLRAMAISGAVLGALPLPFLVAGGWPVAGAVVGLSYGLQLLPAVAAAYRQRDLTGVAAGTWVLALAESALWLTYGVAVADVALIVGGTSGVVMSSLILVRLTVTGHEPLRALAGLRPAPAGS
jgi:uncharacterized protein with PQ loop repeat